MRKFIYENRLSLRESENDSEDLLEFLSTDFGRQEVYSFLNRLRFISNVEISSKVGNISFNLKEIDFKGPIYTNSDWSFVNIYNDKVTVNPGLRFRMSFYETRKDLDFLSEDLTIEMHNLESFSEINSTLKDFKQWVKRVQSFYNKLADTIKRAEFDIENAAKLGNRWKRKFKQKFSDFTYVNSFYSKDKVNLLIYQGNTRNYSNRPVYKLNIISATDAELEDLNSNNKVSIQINDLSNLNEILGESNA